MSNLPKNFLIFNTEQTKSPVIVLEIDGVPGVLSSGPLFKRIRYGDPDIHYGDPGLIYGGLIPLLTSNGGDVQTLIQLDGSSLTLSQTLEPEQGRGSVSTLSFQLIDKDSYITQLFSPGIIVEEIMNRGVTVYIGYKEISYPEDFYQIFRGRISQVQGGVGFGFMQLSDPNVVRRQNIFYQAKTQLTTALTNVATTVDVASNSDFRQAILGPDGSYDPAIVTYMKIEDEFIEYGPSFSLPSGTFGTNTFTNVVRGARGTVAAAHALGADIEVQTQIGPDNCMDMALKLMLSGWGGPWISAQTILNVVSTFDPILLDQPAAYILPSGIDAGREYNLQAGDYFTVIGDPFPANNGTFTVVSFGDLGGTTNRIIYTSNTAAVPSVSTPALFSIRSQYDVYPTSCGSKLTPLDVDIAQHVYLKQTFLGLDNLFRFLIAGAESGKTFIESEVYLPSATYSLTRNGRLSVGLTKPPIATNQPVTLNKDNVLNAPTIRPVRGVNTRKFFNEIDWEYDVDDAGNFTNAYRQLDLDSLNQIGLSSVLPISSKGAHSDLNVFAQIQKRSTYLLSRYKRAAVQIPVQVNFEAGIQIEAGDVVVLDDSGNLQIQNWETGTRNLGTQLYEVVNRSLDFKTGNVTLTLIARLGAQVTDRYGVISPSSKVGVGSTQSEVIITDSYGAIFPGDEQKKWLDYIGLNVIVHSEDWATQDTVQLVGFDTVNQYKMIVSPPLSFTPTAGYIVDIDTYSTSPDPYVEQLYKQSFAHLSPTVNVVSGISSTVFSVSSGDISKFAVGQTVLVHNIPWTTYSSEVSVTDVDTGTNRVTVGTPLGFTPAAGYQVDGIGFSDGGGFYRWI